MLIAKPLLRMGFSFSDDEIVAQYLVSADSKDRQRSLSAVESVKSMKWFRIPKVSETQLPLAYPTG